MWSDGSKCKGMWGVMVSSLFRSASSTSRVGVWLHSPITFGLLEPRPISQQSIQWNVCHYVDPLHLKDTYKPNKLVINRLCMAAP